MMRWSLLTLVTLAAYLAVPSAVRAHALGVECRLEGNRVAVEAFFDDDTPAPHALVRVLDAAGKEVVQGKTDAAGKWTFAAPQPGKYQVHVDAGAGHRVSREVTIPGEASGSRQISEGPSRQEFTEFPWLKVSLGLGTIALFAAAFWLSQRK
jgi:hypothetical protein